MAGAKIMAPIGLSSREGKGAPVKNNLADVELIRRMLIANGFKVAEKGKCDAALIKAIIAAQKKAGLKKPDQIVDPGMTTFKFLLPKYQADLAAVAKLNLQQITWKGKTFLIAEKDLKRVIADMFKKVDRYNNALINIHKANMKTYREYLDTAMIKDGYMDAIAQALIMTYGSVKFPKSSLATKSIDATGALQRAMASKDPKAYNKALPEAEKAINDFNTDVMRFLNEFTGSAGSVHTILKITSGVSFAIVGALAAPILVTGAGMSLAGAGVASAAGAAVLQSGSTELGKHAAGQKVTVLESLQNIVIDATVGAVTAGIGGKIKIAATFGDDLVAATAPRLVKMLPGVTVKQLIPFLKNYIQGAGVDVLKSAVASAAAIIGKVAKTGKLPTQKDFFKAVEDAFIAGVSGGLMKNFGKFNKKWAYNSRHLLEGKILPDVLDKVAKGNVIPPVIRAKMLADVLAVVQGEAIKQGTSAVLGEAKSLTKEAEMLLKAEAALSKDKKIQKKAEVLFRVQMTKYAAQMQP